MRVVGSSISTSSIAAHPPPLHYSAFSRQHLRRRCFPPQCRPFSSSIIPTQTLAASQILPYHANEIFDIIADIPSYPSFIPYLNTAKVTSESSPDPTHKRRWPRTADLRVGYAGYNESFTSRVYCVPYTILEAVAGEAEPTIPSDSLPHYPLPDQPQSAGNSGDLFASLLTRWTFREYPFKPVPPDGPPQEGNAEKHSSSPRTEVMLHIEVKFASAVYAALSQAAAPKVARIMVDAFEKRAREVLGQPKGEVSDAETDADKRSGLFGVGGSGVKV